MFWTKVVQEIKAHILCSIIFSEDPSIYEIKQINIEQPDRPQMTVWRIRFAYWIPGATDTHSE